MRELRLHESQNNKLAKRDRIHISITLYRIH